LAFFGRPGRCIRTTQKENAQRVVGKENLVVFAVSYRDTEAALAAIKKPASNWQINIMKDHNAHVASLYSVSKIPHLVADINRALAAPGYIDK
jgi:hypothetical protein